MDRKVLIHKEILRPSGKGRISFNLRNGSNPYLTISLLSSKRDGKSMLTEIRNGIVIFHEEIPDVIQILKDIEEFAFSKHRRLSEVLK